MTLVEIHVIAASATIATRSALVAALSSLWPEAHILMRAAGITSHPNVRAAPDLAIILHGPLSTDTPSDILAIRRSFGCPIVIKAPSVPEPVHVDWLHLGADVVVGAMSEAKFLAIIEALVRRTVHGAPPPGHVRMVGDIALRADEDYLLVGHRHVHITPTEYRLLDALADGNGACVAASRLALTVWGSDSDAIHKSLKVHISRLRHKLAEVGSTLTVEGVRGNGYRLAPREERV